MLDKYQGDLGGTMIIYKKNNDSFEQKWVWSKKQIKKNVKKWN